MYPVLLDLGWLQIYAYGTAIVLSAAVTGVWAWRSRPAGLLSLEQYLGLAIVTVLGASFGARLTHAVLNGTLEPASLGSALRIWERGGLASLGAPAVVLPMLAVYCHWQRLPLLRILDHLFPFAMLGAGIQRTFGCFLAGCCAGRPTDLPWAVVFPGTDTPVHPTQLYLGVALFMAFPLLRRLRRRRAGFKALLGFALYGGINLAVAFLRADVPALAIEMGPDLHVDLVHGLMAILAAAGVLVQSLLPRWRGLA